MTFDLERARSETPGVGKVLHFNSAGASLMPEPVVSAVVDHIRLEAEIGGYEAADARQERLESVYGSVARLIGSRPEEVAIVENATRAWDMAFYAMRFAPGDRILTTRAEYVSNYLAYLQVARRTGASVEVIDDDPSGRLSVVDLASRLDGRVKLVSITHVPTNGGLVNPAVEVGRLLAGTGITYLLDACQSIGQMPIDVGKIGCDLLAATGRKFLRGPRGTGFLFARSGMVEELEPPFLDVRSARWLDATHYTVRPGARRFETWEGSRAGKLALGVAADYATGWGLEDIKRRDDELASRLRERVGSLRGAKILDLGPEPCAIVSFAIEGIAPDVLKAALGAKRINVSVSAAEDTLLDMSARGYESWIRASVHYFNSEQEVDQLIDELHLIVHSAR